MKIIIDSRIRTFSDIEINNDLPLLQQIISYLDNQGLDTARAKVVYKGKQINPELTILNLPGLIDTPKVFVQYLIVRDNAPDIMPQAPPLLESQPHPEPQPQIAENINHEESPNSNYESDGEEKSTPNSSPKSNIQEKSPNSTQDDSNWDWKLAKLMEEGYEFEDAYKALQEYDGNLEESKKFLSKDAKPEEIEEQPSVSTNDDATILENLLKSKDPTIVDLRAKIRNDPGYIWQWIESLKEKGQKEWIDFFERNAYVIVDAVFDFPDKEEETAKPQKVDKPQVKEIKPPPKEPKPPQRPDLIESDSEMSDVSFDSADSELNEL